jgi:hypothetical protein
LAEGEREWQNVLAVHNWISTDVGRLQKASDMASLYISYSCKDIATARKLTASLESQDLDFWIDWEGNPPILV